MRLIDADEFVFMNFWIPYEYAKAADAYLAGTQDVFDKIVAAPTVDAEPVKHGHWIKVRTFLNGGLVDYEEYEEKCSLCGRHMRRLEWQKNDYCPNCGAKMDGDVDADD